MQKDKIKKNVLVSSASEKTPLIKAMKEAVKRTPYFKLVIAGDLDPNALTKYVADDFWVMPQTKEEHLEYLIRGCKERGISCVFPTRDRELLFWAQTKLLFSKAKIEVIVSPKSSIDICLDKLKFSQFGMDNNLNFIPTSTNLDSLEGQFFVVKERFGAGSKKIGLNLNYEKAMIWSNELVCPIFQPFISGMEISVDAWLSRESMVKGIILRTRDVVFSGESKVSTTFTDSEIEKDITLILEKLKLTGPVNLQALIDEGKNIHVIECNCRFGGASTLSIQAGLDGLYWSLQEALGEDVEKIKFNRIKGKVRQIRMPEDTYDFNI